MGVETEIKLSINQQEVDVIAEVLKRSKSGVTAKSCLQNSYFFDGSTKQLSANGLSVRLRSVIPLHSGKMWWEVTIKGKPTAVSGAVSRPEFEHQISSVAAEQILRHKGVGLINYLPESPLRDTCMRLLNGEEMQLVDGFSNVRRTVGPVSVGGLDGVYLELDKTTFMNGSACHTDAELECEVPHPSHVESVNTFVQSIVWSACRRYPQPAAGKRRRMATFRGSKL